MAALSDSVIILLCILGAGFAVLMGFAVFRFFPGSGADNDDFNQRGNDQANYMRDVRERNKAINHFEARFTDGGHGHGGGGGNNRGAPPSTYSAATSNVY